MNYLLENGWVVSKDGTEKKDILIKDGKIVKNELCNRIDARTIKLDGLYILPGLVDMHVHFRDPGLTYKEDILSGTNAAATGGVTSVATMPNTLPAIDDHKMIEYIINKAKDKKAKVYPIGSVTKGLEGSELVNFKDMVTAGAIAFSDDGMPVKDASILLRAMSETSKINKKIISHCEDLAIVDGGIINKGVISKELGVKGIDRVSEDSVTAREIALAESSGLSIHIAHVSTKLSVDMIRDAKKRGAKVTCETCPHYFSLIEDELLKKDANFRMNPPLRTKEDRDAIIDGIVDGTIDCITTDHAPHSNEDKRDFLKAPNGIIGLETSLSLALNELYHKGKITIEKIVEIMSYRPAKIFGIEGGIIRTGASADIAVVDINKEYVVKNDIFKSKSSNSPFIGKKLKGKTVVTFLDGEIVYNELF